MSFVFSNILMSTDTSHKAELSHLNINKWFKGSPQTYYFFPPATAGAAVVAGSPCMTPLSHCETYHLSENHSPLLFHSLCQIILIAAPLSTSFITTRARDFIQSVNDCTIFIQLNIESFIFTLNSCELYLIYVTVLH